MAFSDKVKDEAVWRSKRSCCVCKDFVGRSVQVHHIVPQSEGGSDEIENAIVLCLRCHAEAGHYNPDHPLGKKYSRDELRRYRDEWWKWCEEHPSAPPPQVPITVSPVRAGLRTGKWRQPCLLKVHNKTDECYYQIYVKLAIGTPGTPSSNISIKPKRLKGELSGDLGSVRVSGDILQIAGTNQAGVEVIFLLIASLDPRETLTFLLENRGPYRNPETARVEVVNTVEGFSQEPPEVLIEQTGNDEAIAIPFRPPETFQLKSFTISTL